MFFSSPCLGVFLGTFFYPNYKFIIVAQVIMAKNFPRKHRHIPRKSFIRAEKLLKILIIFIKLMLLFFMLEYHIFSMDIYIYLFKEKLNINNRASVALVKTLLNICCSI
ncbi:hypothetical protein THII_2254 [Thioploca ingrica]|uniref:Uncharacterized protein n=1 Tax=Thioploca ingrica TaxID=40754 RepID=A0A090BVB2_9GAMM|nr:hypothetical protein THII_2254 [Thioploca ingrica]